jgi:gliding motility-associated protein GldC
MGYHSCIILANDLQTVRLISVIFAAYNLFMNQSTITIDVLMDENRIPESIAWRASDTSIENAQKARAMMLSFWDPAEKTALRIDLWTKDMMVDEMADFFYQTMMTMADSYGRATQHKELTEQMKQAAKDFYNGFRQQQMSENKA